MVGFPLLLPYRVYNELKVNTASDGFKLHVASRDNVMETAATVNENLLVLDRQQMKSTSSAIFSEASGVCCNEAYDARWAVLASTMECLPHRLRCAFLSNEQSLVFGKPKMPHNANPSFECNVNPTF